MQITNDPVFTVDEVAELLKLSRWTVIRILENESGVIDVGSPLTSKRAEIQGCENPHEHAESSYRTTHEKAITRVNTT